MHVGGGFGDFFFFSRLTLGEILVCRKMKFLTPLSRWVAAPPKSLIPQKNPIIQKGICKGDGQHPHMFDAMPIPSKAGFTLLLEQPACSEGAPACPAASSVGKGREGKRSAGLAPSSLSLVSKLIIVP